jgi:uroporphyrinogen-III synthase
VLLVRAAGGEDGDATALAERGIATVQDAYLVTRTCTDPDAVARAGRVLALLRAEADVLLLTSRTALRALMELAGEAEVRAAVATGVARGLTGAAVGPTTAAALRELGIDEVVEPEVATSRGLLARLRGAPDGRSRVAVLPCGAQAMKGLGAGLREDGWSVEEVVLYATEQVLEEPPSVADLAAGRIAAVVVRSPTAVRAVAARVPRLPRGTTLVCGGPTTAAAARETFDAAIVVSDGPTAGAVADTVARVLEAGTDPGRGGDPRAGGDPRGRPGTLGASEPERP